MFNPNDLGNLDWLSDLPPPITNDPSNESVDSPPNDDDDAGVVEPEIMRKLLDEIQNYQTELNGMVMNESIVPSLTYLGSLIGRSTCLMRKFDKLRIQFDHDLDVVYRSIDSVAQLKRVFDAMQNFVKQNSKNLRILLERKRVSLLEYFARPPITRFQNRPQHPRSNNNNNGNNRNGQWNYSGYKRHGGRHNLSATSHVPLPSPRSFLMNTPAYTFIRPPNPLFWQRQFNLNDLIALNNLVVMLGSNDFLAWQNSGPTPFYLPPVGGDELLTIYQFYPDGSVTSVICIKSIKYV